MVTAPFKPQFLLVCGISAALVSCTGEGASRNLPTRFVSIQPIQVCDDLGLFCADLALFEEATRKIWAQASIDVSFLAPNRLNASRFLSIDNQDEFAELSFAGGAGAFGRNPLSTRTSGPINMWFVKDIFAFEGFETLGLAWIDQNGIVISDAIQDFNNGIGRLDTVAHEIGHNLGLTHQGFGSGGANNLMTEGFARNVPSSLDDITPDGAGLDRLTNAQIDFARASTLTQSTPELLGGGGPVGVPTTLPQLSDDSTDTILPPAEPTFDSTNTILPPAEPTLVAALALQPEAAFAVSHPPEPQPIPNGPAMGLITAGLLAGYLGSQRQRA